MSGTQVSSFGDPNLLLQTLSGAQTATVQRNQLLNQQTQQTLGENEAEMLARASAGLLSLPTEEARAAAYPQAVQQLRQYGFGKNAPETYPGEATLRRVALLGTPSSKQAEWNYNTGANQAGLGPTPTAPAVTTPGTGTADSSQPVTPSGTATIGQRQNNPGNLTFAGQPGAQPGQGNRFAAFPDMPTGVAANAAQLALYQTQHGINTVRGAVTRWVGDPKADLTSYVGDIAKALGVGPDDPIDLTNPDVQAKFIQAQFPHESAGGGYVLNPADVQRGVQMAAQQRGQPVQQRPAQTAAATPPGTTTPPAASTAPPASPFGAGAFTPPTRTVAAAPTTTATAPNVATNLIPPVNSPQMVAAQAVAARTGKPAPIEGTDGLFALPGGGVRNAAGGLTRSAAADATVEGQQTAATTLPPQGTVVAAGPAAGGGAVPVAPAEAPVSAFGGGAFATPPPNMLAPGAPGAPAPATVPPAPQNVVAPTPAPVAPAAPTAPAPAPAPAAPAMPQPPRLPAMGADNLTADDRRQLQTMVRDDPARFTAAKTAMQARNIAAQDRAADNYRQDLAAYRLAKEHEYQHLRNAGADQRSIDEAARQAQAAKDAHEKAVREAAEAPTEAQRKAQAAALAQTQQQFQQENTLRDEFQKLTADFRVVQNSYENLHEAAKKPSGAGDMSLLYSYVRLLDPTSVVRESEFATAAASGSFGERVQGAVGRILSGERLPDSLRNDFVREAGNLYKTQLRNHNQTADTYTRLAESSGLDPKKVVTRFDRPQVEDRPPLSSFDK